MVRGRRGAGARGKCVSAVAGLWAAAAGVELEPARAQGAPIALTAELQVNQFTTGAQSSPSVGMRDDGVHVVVWVSAGQDGDGDGIVQRKFASDGSEPFNESVLNQNTAGAQLLPEIGMNALGDWIAVWDSTAAGAGIRGRATASNGTILGAEIPVSITTSAQIPNTARADDDGFVATWDIGGAQFRAFDATSTATTGDELVAPALGSTSRPAPGFASDGSFVVAFVADDGNGTGVFAQRFDADAQPVGAPIPVPESTANDDTSTSIGVADDGSFVVGWRDSALGQRLRCFRADGTPRGGEIALSPLLTGGPRIGMSPQGHFVATFAVSEMSVQEFDRTCRFVGDDFFANTATAGVQTSPHAAAGRDRYAVVWHTNGVDGDSGSVARRLFRFRTIYADDFESDDLASWSAVVP